MAEAGGHTPRTAGRPAAAVALVSPAAVDLRKRVGQLPLADGTLGGTTPKKRKLGGCRNILVPVP